MMLTIYNRQKQEVGGLFTSGSRCEVKDVQIRKRINAEYELQFQIPMSSSKYPLIQEEGLIECQGQLYVIKSRERRREGMGNLVTVTCPHVMRRLMDIRVPYEQVIEEKLGCDITYLTNILSAATGGRFTFQIMDTIAVKDVYKWGFSNCLKALQDLVNLYEVEFVPDNYNIKIYKKINIDNGREYRYARNIISDTFETNTNTLVTRMTGLAKDSLTIIGLSASYLTITERNSLNLIPGAIVNSVIKVPYLISQYAASWATPDNAYFDGEFEDTDIEADTESGKLQLLNEIRKKMKEQEVPDMQVRITPLDLHKKPGSTDSPPQLGETVYMIDQGMELDDIAARIVEMMEYPFDPAKSSELTIANYMLRDMNQIIADLDASKNFVENLFTKGSLNRSALDAFLQQAVQDVINSKTEIKYPANGGFLLQDKNNALLQTYLKSNGILISNDGGQTAKTAITGNGVAAEYVVGMLGEFAKIRANQIDVTGGRITAGQIDATSLQVAAANVTGQLTASQINATNLQVAAANITGQLTASQINVAGLFVGPGGIGISPTASIGWGQVTDKNLDYTAITGTKPPASADNTATAIGADRLTYIDSHGIYTGTLTADKIVGTDFLAMNTINIGNYSTNTQQKQLGFNNSVVMKTYMNWLGLHACLDVSADELKFSCNTVKFSRPVDFTGATVTGLNIPAKFQ